MKTIIKSAAAALVLLCAASTVLAAPSQEQSPTCIWSRDVLRTHTPDNRTILFRMRDGRVYRNRLAETCTGLKTFGFGYVTPEDRICNRMMIHILRTGHDCMLGRFELMPQRATD